MLQTTYVIEIDSLWHETFVNKKYILFSRLGYGIEWTIISG